MGEGQDHEDQPDAQQEGRGKERGLAERAGPALVPEAVAGEAEATGEQEERPATRRGRASQVAVRLRT